MSRFAKKMFDVKSLHNVGAANLRFYSVWKRNQDSKMALLINFEVHEIWLKFYKIHSF